MDVVYGLVFILFSRLLCYDVRIVVFSVLEQPRIVPYYRIRVVQQWKKLVKYALAVIGGCGLVFCLGDKSHVLGFSVYFCFLTSAVLQF